MFTSLLKKSQSSFSEPCLDSSIPSGQGWNARLCHVNHSDWKAHANWEMHADLTAVQLFTLMHLDPERIQYLPVLSHHVVVELMHIKKHAVILHVLTSCWCAPGYG